MTGQDRGVSDALGYVFVFAIITITIGLIYASGITGLTDVQQNEQTDNVQQAFEVLDNNIQDLTQRGAESRATEMKLSGGSITVGQSVILHVKTNSTQPTVCNETRPTTISTRPIVYQKDGEEVIYSIGAVFRSDGTNSAMVSRPEWVVGDENSIISMVTTTTAGSTSTGGHTSILVVAKKQGRSLRCTFEEPSTPVRVNVTIESARAPAWEQYFDDQGYDVTSSSQDRVVAKFNTSQFYLTDTTVEFEYVS